MVPMSRALQCSRTIRGHFSKIKRVVDLSKVMYIFYVCNTCNLFIGEEKLVNSESKIVRITETRRKEQLSSELHLKSAAAIECMIETSHCSFE